jgi:dihydrofolate reductase
MAAKLVYSAISSLDGFIQDADGNFDWAAPDEELHGFINDLERSVGTYLYGRRMYETMVVWESDDILVEQPDVVHDYARIWRAADKIVYSRTLDAPSSAKTTLEREFDPEAVRRMKETAERDIGVGGSVLTAQAMRARLVDEMNLVLVPVVIGSGKRALPDDLRIDLELLDERRFAAGAVHLRYRVV